MNEEPLCPQAIAPFLECALYTALCQKVEKFEDGRVGGMF